MQISNHPSTGAWRALQFKNKKEEEAFRNYLNLLNISYLIGFDRQNMENYDFLFTCELSYRYVRDIPSAIKIIEDFNELMNHENN